MLDPDQLDSHLDRLAEGLEECRAALAVAREGDPTALQEFSSALDAMAQEIAALKAATVPAAG